MANKKKNNNVLRVCQCNLGRRKGAHDLMVKFVHERDIQIVIAPEPNVKTVSAGDWIVDKTKTVAVKVWDKKLQVRSADRGESWVCLQLEAGDIYGVYISPNIPIEQYKEKVKEIIQKIQTSGRESVVAGDINARSQLWGSQGVDVKGQVWEESFAALNMTVANDGQTPTFVGLWMHWLYWQNAVQKIRTSQIR